MKATIQRAACRSSATVRRKASASASSRGRRGFLLTSVFGAFTILATFRWALPSSTASARAEESTFVLRANPTVVFASLFSLPMNAWSWRTCSGSSRSSRILPRHGIT